jgi:phospholipid/cholesterol/gamma-HCH transport system substrate-binding protein
MRAAAVTALVIAAATVVAIIGLGAGDDDGGDYKVRAIFENAGFAIPGEDVKVAGVKVGAIDDVEVTDDLKAAVVLDITDPGYQDFRQDASCIVRPQSLIGERFVECQVTQARPPGTEPPPELEKIDEGPGKGQYLLPVERTAKAVDLDLINNIMREPVRQRLSVFLDDLGIGVAGRGDDLAEVIRRADPALKAVDDALKILGRQNRVLADLAVSSDTVLEPLARERRHVSGAIENAGAVARATAERRADLAADVERLPVFLRELTPTMVRLGALSDEMTPVLTDLGDVAPDINRLVLELGPFSQAGIPALESLGDAAETGTPAVRAALPVTRDVRRLATQLRPVSATARRLLESLQRSGGINRFMDYLFFQVAALNGFDTFGHYLRAALIVNQCANYSIQPVFGCSANFAGSAAAATASLAKAKAPRLVRTPHRAKPAPKRAPARRATPAPERKPAARRPGTPAPTATPAPKRDRQSRTETLLDYLFGDDR